MQMLNLLSGKNPLTLRSICCNKEHRKKGDYNWEEIFLVCFLSKKLSWLEKV